MIVYIATYPRCGSGLIRRALYQNFGIITANGYPDPPGALDAFDLRPFGGREEDGDAALLMSYRVPGRHPRRPIIIAPALPKLTPPLRQRLASEDAAYFVKTHELPYDRYFPGERVVGMIRHPAPALASQYELKRRLSPHAPTSLERFIVHGGVGGDWSTYHHQWGQAEVPRLQLRYEETLVDQVKVIREIARFLSLPIGDVVVDTLEQANARNPTRNPAAGPDGWRQTISDDMFKLLWSTHGDVAKGLGYGRNPSAPPSGSAERDIDDAAP